MADMGIFVSKLREVLVSTGPIVLVLAILAIFVLKMPAQDILNFLLCVVLVVFGFSLFLTGVDLGINPVGRDIGKEIPKRKSKLFMIGIVFLISFLVTVSEPDVTVFAVQVCDLFSSINVSTLTLAIAGGVAIFLIIAAFKIVYNLSLRVLITIGYAIVIILALILYFTGSSEFLGIAFDSGGVTTGPVTVPILLSLGIGICSIGAKRNEIDGFGMVGLASIGPIIAVLTLGLFTGTSGGSTPSTITVGPLDWVTANVFIASLRESAMDVVIALVPLILFFMIFKRVFLRYSWASVLNTVEYTVIAGIGIIIFLTGVYTGFIPIAKSLGVFLGNNSDDMKMIIIGLGILLGFLVAFAEPAVSILGSQVERSSGGMLTKKKIVVAISLGVAAIVGLGMMKLVFNINFLYIIIPGYVITLILMWLGDKNMVGIAFDAGGVSTGPMSVAILSSIYIGLASAMYTGTQAVIYGFGLIALIALAPCLFLSILGIYIKVKKKKEGSYA